MSKRTAGSCDAPTMADIVLQHAGQAVLDKLIEDGGEVGLQAVVMKDGALVADARSGVADPARGEPVSAGTVRNVGTTGSAAYADIDTGGAIALMRNRFSPDFTAIAHLHDIVTKAYPPPANPEDRSP